MKFDAEKFVKTAKDAGMKYIVIISKHHDGFCMWKTELANYNIHKWIKFERDIITIPACVQLACRWQACRAKAERERQPGVSAR